MTNSSKIAVIAGGMGYVGSAAALRLAKDGIRIALLYHTSTEQEVSAMLAGLSDEGHKAYRCDVRDADSVKRTIAKIEGEMGPIYAAIDAVGIPLKPKQLLASSVEEVLEQFDAGVSNSFNFLSACALRLKERNDGVIIGITTAIVATDLNTKSRGVYGAVKFAIQGLLTAFKEELAPYGVRVYSIAPGAMAGGLNKDMPKAFLDMVREKSSTKKLATAEDVAEKISYLCSDNARGEKQFTFLIAPESASKQG